VSVRLMNWIPVSHLSLNDFTVYLSTVDNEEIRSTEIQRYSKRHAVEIMCMDMLKYTTFYDFVKVFSPNDYKLIKGKSHVSQRVTFNTGTISTHQKPSQLYGFFLCNNGQKIASLGKFGGALSII